MNDLSKRLATFGVSAIGAFGLLVLPGCGAAPATEESAGSFHLATAEEAQLSAAGQPSELDPGVPGEAEEELASGVESTSAQNCVYIQWCNEPGYWGSVCRVRASCVNQCNNYEVLRQECIRDANYVCGAITEPSIGRGCP